MLPSKRRISKAEFKSFNRGVSYHSPLIFLSVYKKTDSSQSQFSFVCSKKISKSAVRRNLLRRRGYSIVGKMIEDIRPGAYFVFNFKKGAESASFSEIEKQIQLILKNAGALG